MGLGYPLRRRNDGRLRRLLRSGLYSLLRGANMDRRKANIVVIGAALSVAGIATASSTALAQTFQSYRCADGTQFIVGFFEYDNRAYLQIDGRPVTLGRRLSLSGSHYSGGGVTLKITKADTTVKRARRPTTSCELI
jgi:membrane-bound inhibitor of C-type lysozyme